MSFANNLFLLMRQEGVTNYRLSKDLGVCQTTIANWKNGKMPQLAHLKKVADYFNVTMDELVDSQDATRKS